MDYLSSPPYEFKRSPPCSGPSCPPPPPGSTFTPVIGVPENIVERRPIAVLQNDHADAFNMLVLALESLQGRNESIDISYYQVSGKTCINANSLAAANSLHYFQVFMDSRTSHGSICLRQLSILAWATALTRVRSSLRGTGRIWFSLRYRPFVNLFQGIFKITVI